MSLFSDTDVVTAAMLAQVDSEVAAIAAASKPSILLDGPGSICELAWRECGGMFLAAHQMYTPVFTAIGVSGGHQAAVNNIGSPARNQSRSRLNQIVATESQYANSSSAVQRWVTYKALELFYRDASTRVKQDRLGVKYDRFVEDTDFAWRQLRQIGLPWLAQPMEAPGAKHGANAGTWTAANLTAVAGPGTARILQVAITYYDGSRYIAEGNTFNAESGPSVILPMIMAAGTVLQVSIASLNPPTGVMDQVGLSEPAWTPLNATNWVLWIGIAGGPLYWQAALPIAQQTFTMPGDPVLSGAMLGTGQNPDANLTFQRVIGRG
jgi:hypothetical protein